MDNINVSKLVQRLVNQKMLISHAAHTSLVKQIESLLEQPNVPTIGGLNDYLIDSTFPDAEQEGSTGVITISGILAKDVSPAEDEALGLVDVEWIYDALSNCAQDPNIKHIVINFNSPGGETCGIEELGRLIDNIDTHIKPVYGWTDKMATSAAYWLLSQCRNIGMIPSSEVGGVGVYSLVLDATEQMKQEGLSMFVAQSGKYKMMGHEFRSLTDEEKKILQDDSDKQHEKFKATIMAKRPAIKAEDCEGLSFEGQTALQKGFVDILFDSMEEYLIYINSSAVMESSNMKKLEKTKVATSAETKVEETPTTAAVKVEEIVIAQEAVTPVIEKKAEAVPGVPGTEESGKYDGGYAQHPEPDGDEPENEDEDEYEECTCCKGSGKMKKAKKEEEKCTECAETKPGEGYAEKAQEPDGDEDTPKKMELPSTEEWQGMFGIKKQAISKEKTEWDGALKNTFSGQTFNK